MGEADGIPKVEQNHTLPRTVALITSHDPGHSLLRQRKDSINLLIKATSCSSSLLTLLSKLDKTSDSRRSVSLQDGVNSYFTNLYSKFFHLKFCVVSSAIKMCSFCWRRIREMIFFSRKRNTCSVFTWLWNNTVRPRAPPSLLQGKIRMPGTTETRTMFCSACTEVGC